jgi:hypothetical protein
MAHYLSQEQVLGIRSRLFASDGRVTAGGVRSAVRVLGQDELSDDEALRLVGIDGSRTPLGSFVRAGAGGAAAGGSNPSSSRGSSREKQRRHEKRQARREAKRKLKTRHDYFIASSSSDSDSDDDDESNSKDKSKKKGKDGSFRIPMKLEDDFVFPFSVDFPMFLQRLNRLVQDRETVRELKQLFYVLARFAFERRQRDLQQQHQQQQSYAASGGGRVSASQIAIALSASGGGGAMAAAAGGDRKLSPTKPQQQQQRGPSSSPTKRQQQAAQPQQQPLLNQTTRSATATLQGAGFDASSFLAVQAGDQQLTTPDGLNANSSRRDLERFLGIRSSVDKTSIVSQQQLELQSQMQRETSNNSAASASAAAGDAMASAVNKSSASSASASDAAAVKKANAAFFISEETNLLNNPTVLTREELRQIMAEVLESAARKSTGIDHVIAGLDEGENFITCERFISLILRGGPEVVASLYLL